MADKKISQLTGASTPLAGSEVLPIVQSSSTVKVSVDNLTRGKTVYATTFDTDVAAAGVTLTGVTLAADGTDSNIDINITPKGSGEVNLPKVDIDSGAIDGTAIGSNSATTGKFTTLEATTLVNSATAAQLSLRNTHPGNSVSAGVTFGFNTAAADPDVLASVYGVMTDRSARTAILNFYTAVSGTIGLRATITGTGDLLVNSDTSYGRITSKATDSPAIGTIVATQINYNAASFHNSAGTQCGRILVYNAGTTDYIQSSDRRLKENIVPAGDAGEILDSIEIVEFDWKGGLHTRYGVIAQDLYAVAPEVVGVGDPEDAVEMKETWGVDYGKLVPMLIKEVQSLRKRVAELEAK